MQRIEDEFGNCACMADAETGRVEHEYKHCRLSMVIPIGGQFTIERGNRVTTIVRTIDGFKAISKIA